MKETLSFAILFHVKVNNMGAKGGRSPRVSAGQMEAVYHLECRQAGEEAVPLSHT